MEDDRDDTRADQPADDRVEREPVSNPKIPPAPDRVPESPDNLKQRQEWFRRRTQDKK